MREVLKQVLIPSLLPILFTVPVLGAGPAKRPAPDKVQAAIDRLSLTEAFFRIKAAEELGKLGANAERALPKLDELTKSDENEKVRKAAAEAAAKIRAAIAEAAAKPPPVSRIELKSVPVPPDEPVENDTYKDKPPNTGRAC